MELTLVCLGIYLTGCLLSLLVFLLGRSPGLSNRNWFWPVVFLWPALALWPAYFIAESFLKWKIRKNK